LGFGVSYLLFDFIGVRQLSAFETNIALSSPHLPLWKDKRFAVNPDRAYFELVDNDNNELSIFHSGLYLPFPYLAPLRLQPGSFLIKLSEMCPKSQRNCTDKNQL
jgi:hypothetical protein